MPILEISVNVEVAQDVKTAILGAISPMLASILGKPETYVCVLLHSNVGISFGGDDSKPAAFCRLHSLGGVNGKTTTRLPSLSHRHSRRSSKSKLIACSSLLRT
eukprot:TRINITY_DN3625_c0_g1_i1.p1 TRINITY_DN3625_c0_g1~~TRINITY_DN3625_c0_g1_i1.p1  ORF type:complete len:118 (+),score=36.78 TRINITY_DN3625_c0_g1_i1:45-356(+)